VLGFVWRHISYALLGPLQMGDAVMEFMDNLCRSADMHIQNVSEADLFNMWCVGNTGSKLVDAGMRQLWKEGWMPRRMRLLSAACLVEGLGSDWRLGRDWFEHTLVDHDPATTKQCGRMLV
jgi:deoxyribodipyrimidine photolyase